MLLGRVQEGIPEDMVFYPSQMFSGWEGVGYKELSAKLRIICGDYYFNF